MFPLDMDTYLCNSIFISLTVLLIRQWRDPNASFTSTTSTRALSESRRPGVSESGSLGVFGVALALSIINFGEDPRLNVQIILLLCQGQMSPNFAGPNEIVNGRSRAVSEAGASPLASMCGHSRALR